MKIPATSVPVGGERSAEEAATNLESGLRVPLPTFGSVGGEGFSCKDVSTWNELTT